MEDPKARPCTNVEVAELRRFVEDLLRAAGCDIGVARATADVFVEADLRGFDLQGLDHVPTVLKEIRAGKVRPEARPVVRAKEGSTAIVDARRAPGPIAAVRAADVAIETASRAGCAAVGVVDGNDLYMLGYYAERIARSRLIGIVLTTGRALVHPYGGIERVLATNPLAVAVPRPGPHPFLLEMATSSLAAGRVRQAAYYGETLPEGTGVGPDGLPSRNAATVRAGAISPMAGHKGYGLSLAIALLAGPLLGAVVGKARDDQPGWSGSPGQLFLALDPAAFGRADGFLEAVEGYLLEVKSSRRAPGVDEIRFPGERAFAERDKRLREGIPIQDAVLARLEPWAAELKVPMIG